MTIGKLERVPLRDLWKHEERGFSAWLSDNLDQLADAVGFSIAEPEKEVGAGDFECDIVAEDEDGHRVIIENQLEATDHDHLGKLITYLTNLDAKRAIWICKTPRPEHTTALAWLNETTPEDVAFYLVKLEAFRIGSSAPAPLFTAIVAPSAESKQFGQEKKNLAERHQLRIKFWEGLLARAKHNGVLSHSGRSPSKDFWLSATAGKAGFGYVYTIWKTEESGVELYIDVGDQALNKTYFDRLLANRGDIEGAFGGPLDWERLDTKKGARIRHIMKTGGLADGEAAWPAIQGAMIAAMEKLVNATKPYIQKIEQQG